MHSAAAKPTNYLYTRKVFIIYWQNVGQTFASVLFPPTPAYRPKFTLVIDPTERKHNAEQLLPSPILPLQPH